MKKLVIVSTCSLAVAVLASQLFANVTPPTVKCRVFGVSPNLVAQNIPGIDRPSNGLPNVAPNTKVYLYCGGKPSAGTGTDLSATHFKSATFALFAKPSGSASDIVTIDSIRAFFIPDMVGTYRVTMTGTDDRDRSGTDTLVVNVAKYVGVGGIVGTAGVPECSTVYCHGAQAPYERLKKADTWKLTAHATALFRKLDDPDTAASHFRQASCVPCHTTGPTDPDEQGNGWQQRAKTLGWMFPAAIGPGTSDALIANYPELAKMSNIQCENCHGPGSAHLGNTQDNKIAVIVTSEQCNQCHDAPPYHIKKAEYENSAHSRSLDEPGSPEYMNRGSKTDRNSDCARCHTSNGYIDVWYRSADPLTAYTNAPYKDVGYVGCATCHNPHDATNEHQLRKPVDQICADCHSIRVSSYSGLHSSHQGPMLAGTDGKEFPGHVYENSAHSYIAVRCAQCHMADPPDPSLQNKIGGHTFRVRYDNGTPGDRSDDIVNNTGCVTCHGGDVNLRLIDQTQNEIKGMLEQLRQLLPQRPDGTPKFPSDTTMTQLQRDCAWNWYFVNNDGSYGVHNHNYAKDLLDASIAELQVLGVQRLGEVPGSFALAQNYPNPFTPNTEIRFDVAAAANVRIAVYDASGRFVNLLVNGAYAPGTYRVRWNGTGRNTVAMPAGVYFYTMTAGTFAATRKMMYLK